MLERCSVREGFDAIPTRSHERERTSEWNRRRSSTGASAFDGDAVATTSAARETNRNRTAPPDPLHPRLAPHVATRECSSATRRPTCSSRPRATRWLSRDPHARGSASATPVCTSVLGRIAEADPPAPDQPLLTRDRHNPAQYARAIVRDVVLAYVPVASCTARARSCDAARPLTVRRRESVCYAPPHNRVARARARRRGVTRRVCRVVEDARRPGRAPANTLRRGQALLRLPSREMFGVGPSTDRQRDRLPFRGFPHGVRGPRATSIDAAHRTASNVRSNHTVGDSKRRTPR